MDNKDEADTDVYLIFEGKFIKAILIAFYCILGASFLSIGIIACCVYKRDKAEDKVTIANGDVSMKR